MPALNKLTIKWLKDHPEAGVYGTGRIVYESGQRREGYQGEGFRLQ